MLRLLVTEVAYYGPTKSDMSLVDPGETTSHDESGRVWTVEKKLLIIKRAVRTCGSLLIHC